MLLFCFKNTYLTDDLNQWNESNDSDDEAYLLLFDLSIEVFITTKYP